MVGLHPSPRWLYMYDEDGNEFDKATWGWKLNEHWYNQKGGGTGPYRFVRWEPGVVIEMEASAEYWSARPPFDTVQMKLVQDQQSWPRKLKAGEADITRLQPEQYKTEIKDNYNRRLPRKRAHQVQAAGHPRLLLLGAGTPTTPSSPTRWYRGGP